MTIDFEKTQGLVPVIIQHQLSLQVLMLGYMNEAAFIQTQAEQKVTFFSRSKNRLWTKGESSGNFLWVKAISIDCDNDTLLIKAIPENEITCHTGALSCFQEETAKGFAYQLEAIIAERIQSKNEASYTTQLYQQGINKIAQKVGEEAVELIIEAKDNNQTLFNNEAADLLYHFLLLLKAKNTSLEEIESVLKSRH